MPTTLEELMTEVLATRAEVESNGRRLQFLEKELAYGENLARQRDSKKEEEALAQWLRDHHRAHSKVLEEN